MNDELTTSRIVHSQTSPGRNFVACLIVLGGVLVLLFISWIIGLLIIAAGMAFHTKPRHHSSCGECGNEVANTSRICPCCHAHFTETIQPPVSTTWFYILAGLLISSALIWLGYLWLVQRVNG